MCTHSLDSRWMRLLFGREVPFDDVLLMWDLLFAHGLRSDLVDFTCIAMLLRIRWQCWFHLNPPYQFTADNDYN